MKHTAFITFVIFVICSCSCSHSVLRLGSYNIRGNQECDGINQWQFRKDSLSQIILREGFKLVGLQEAVPDQREDIVSITRYNWVGAGDLNNPILFDPSRIEMIEWDMFWLNEGNVPHVAGWDGKYERYCTWGRSRTLKVEKNSLYSILTLTIEVSMPVPGEQNLSVPLPTA